MGTAVPAAARCPSPSCTASSTGRAQPIVLYESVVPPTPLWPANSDVGPR